MTQKLPDGFSYLEDPRFIIDMAYLGSDNFVGRPIAGYKQNICIGTDKLITGLIKAQDDLDALDHGFALKIFDAYRPQTAVNDFVKWSEDADDNKTKPFFYPALSKSDIFEQGYVLARSTHSRGSAVDLTIVKLNLDTGYYNELDMGTRFDFFGDQSHTDYPGIAVEARAHRQMLRLLMEKHGFKNYMREWWHYNVVEEQFPDTYFDFPVE